MSLATAPNLAFVPVDFESDSLFESLCHSGYRPGAPGFFSWLAVTQYLTREAIFDTLRMVASMASGTDQNEERMRLFDRVAAFLVNASKANPIMLHLEDLHWADKPSLSLLQHLARRFEGGRLLVVGTYRDVELDRSHPLSTMVGELRHERLYQRVVLRGLSESEVKELIEAISQQRIGEGSGEAFVRAILHETEGNPFFIEEVLRHLVESGGLYRRDGRWVTDAEAVADMKVPEDVRDVIGRRLARLSETTYRVLLAGAVLGREFEFEVLSRMSELAEDLMVQAIEEALSRRLLVETQDGGRVRYGFTHALVRHTLVEELSLPRKQRLHLKAAQAIEAVHERNLEPHMSALANHYRTAGAAADPEKAIDYSIRAGNAANSLFAYEEAGAHWRAALELMDEQSGSDRKRRADLLWRLGGSRGLVSSGAEAVEYLEAAAALFEELGDNQAACDVHMRLASYLSTEDVGAMDVRRAMPHFNKAEALLATQPESHRHAVFYIHMAGACLWTRRIADGLTAAKRAMEITERMGPPDQLGLADFRLTSESSERSARIRIERLIDGYWSGAAATSSQLLVHSGSVTEGLRLVDQARRRAEPLNSTIGTLVAGCGALNSTLLGNPREAKEWCKSELAKPRTAHAAQRAGPDAPAQNYALNLRTMLVNACIWAGEFAEARTYLAEGGRIRRSLELLFFEGEWELAGNKLTAWSERSRRSGSRQDEVMAAVQLARLHRLTGERAQAVQALRRALEISVDGGDVLFELTTRSALATMAADTGDPVEAVPHLQRCRQIVAAGENWFGLAGVVERAEAVVAAAQGEYALAEDQFKKAITTFQHYCLAWEEADTLQHWGRALLAAGERARTIEKFDAAIEIYRSHGYGTRFIEYVMADKTRARRTRSRRHPAVQAPLTGSDLGGSRRIGEISIAASS